MKPEIKKILYATDLSETASYAFGHAVDLAEKYNAEIILLYVMEKMNHLVESQIKDMLGEIEWKRLKSEKHEQLLKIIRVRLENFCTEMEAQLPECPMLVNDIIIQQGQPAEEILNTAEKTDADLIVIGSYGHNRIASTLIGGTARKVLRRSRIPVLVVQLPGK